MGMLHDLNLWDLVSGESIEFQRSRKVVIRYF